MQQMINRRKMQIVLILDRHADKTDNASSCSFSISFLLMVLKWHHVSQSIIYGVSHRNVFFPKKYLLSVEPEHHVSKPKLMKLSYVNSCINYK